MWKFLLHFYKWISLLLACDRNVSLFSFYYIICFPLYRIMTIVRGGSPVYIDVVWVILIRYVLFRISIFEYIVFFLMLQRRSFWYILYSQGIKFEVSQENVNRYLFIFFIAVYSPVILSCVYLRLYFFSDSFECMESCQYAWLVIG